MLDRVQVHIRHGGQHGGLVKQNLRAETPLPESALAVVLGVRPPGDRLAQRLHKDTAQLELFQTLCIDVMAAGELAVTEADALERAIRRTFRWHHLLRGGKSQVLTEEAQKGLIGEIEVLKRLIATLGPKAALTAWTGPSGAPKDFELRKDCIEVKARRVASQPFVKITSEHQLCDVPNRRLWLAVIAVDRVEPPHGRTLAEHVAEVTGFLEQLQPSAVTDWGLHLADAGFDELHDYSECRWIVASPEFHAVADGFPRISTPVPVGVAAVSYSLALAACRPFQTDWTIIRSRLLEDDPS